VQYHPTMEHIFVTGDRRGNVCLRDTRMAFGSKTQRKKDGVALKVGTATWLTSRRLLTFGDSMRRQSNIRERSSTQDQK
jgi:WD repeat-containing protein 22